MKRSNLLAKTAQGLFLLATIVMLGYFVLNEPVIGHDSFFHLTNLDQFISLRREGVRIPRWTPNNFMGFGLATFYFYPPLVYILSSFVALPGVHSLNAILNIFGLVVSAFTMLSVRYYFRTLGYRNSKAWQASAIVVVAPYLFYDAIIRSAFSEYCAFAFIPLVFASIEIALSNSKQRALRSAIVSSVAWSLLVLTSVPVTVLTVVCTIVYVLSRTPFRRCAQILPVILGGLLASCCTAYYLLPIVALKDWVHLQHVFAFDDYRPFRDFWLANILNSRATIGDYLQILLFPLTGLVCYQLFRLYRESGDLLDRCWFMITCFILAMQLPWLASAMFHWGYVLSLIQFPTRFYLLAGFSMAVYFLRSPRPHFRSAYVLVALSSIAVLILATYAAHGRMGGSGYAITSKLDWNAFEYTPKWVPNDTGIVRSYVNSHANDAEVVAIDSIGPTDHVNAARNGDLSTISARLSRPTRVAFHRFFWPEWRLETSTHIAIAMSADPNGRLICTLPAGNYSGRLFLAKSKEEVLGATGSIVGIVILASLLLYAILRDRAARRQHPSPNSI